jgi:hypothetical protein
VSCRSTCRLFCVVLHPNSRPNCTCQAALHAAVSLLQSLVQCPSTTSLGGLLLLLLLLQLQLPPLAPGPAASQLPAATPMPPCHCTISMPSWALQQLLYHQQFAACAVLSCMQATVGQVLSAATQQA